MTGPSGAVLARVLERSAFTSTDARRIFDRLVDEGTPEIEKAGILVGLATRPLDARDLTAFAREMRRRANPFPVPRADAAIDLCGSGGAAVPSFNVSTVSAFVVAAAGVPVVKHGNRSATGLCGSSDLLEALGLPVTSSIGFAEATYRAHRLAFLHAPLYHPATKSVSAVRRALGIPTIFNRLGPLTNPANVPYQLAGAADPLLARAYAQALPRLGVRRGASVSSDDGCDELSPVAPSTACLWGRAGRKTVRLQTPGLLQPPERKGSWGPLPPKEAAAEAESLLSGRGGARLGSVLLTSGLALWLVGRAGSIDDGVRLARGVVNGGDAAQLLAQLRRMARDDPTRGAA
jgi:anthranilate phosphoribosyltransferase